jgi:hypothetical protein
MAGGLYLQEKHTQNIVVRPLWNTIMKHGTKRQSHMRAHALLHRTQGTFWVIHEYKLILD